MSSDRDASGRFDTDPQALRGLAGSPARRAPGGEGRRDGVPVDSKVDAERLHLRLVQRDGVVPGVADERQLPALECVGEQYVGPGRQIDAVEGVAQLGEVVAPQVRQQVLELRVVPPRQQAAQVVRVAADARHPFADDRGVTLSSRWYMSLDMSSMAARSSSPLGSWKAACSFLPYLASITRPAVRGEHLAPHPDADAGDDAVEALAVEVDDPENVLRLGHGVVGDSLPHDALVQLGVAEQADVPSLDPGLRIESGSGVRLGQGREVGGHGAQAHGAGGEVDAVRVLRAAGVRLQTVEPPQRLQVLGRQIAQQVLDRVVDGRRVRLDGDPVAGAHVLEEQVRQDRHDRRARRLVAADLQVSGARPARCWRSRPCRPTARGRGPGSPGGCCRGPTELAAAVSGLWAICFSGWRAGHSRARTGCREYTPTPPRGRSLRRVWARW